VGGIGHGSQALTQHVYLPVGALSTVNQPVERPCGRPHDVGARLIVLWILLGLARTDDERAHQSLGNVVAGVVVVAGEVLLQDVRHDVVDARHHLIFGYGISELGVEDGEVGIAEVVEELLLLAVGRDDRPAVHLRAGARHGEHDADGNPTAVARMMLLEIILPHILLLPCRRSHSLGIVARGTAAHGENHIHVLPACELSTLQHLLDVGVRHHAAFLDDRLAGVVQHLHHLVVDAIALDGATTVGEHHLRTVVLQFLGQAVESLLAKMNPRGILISEVS